MRRRHLLRLAVVCASCVVVASGGPADARAPKAPAATGPAAHGSRALAARHAARRVRPRAGRVSLSTAVARLIQQGGKLTGGGETGSGEFGWSVALSADGNTALVGAASDNAGTGAAWVFTRTGSTWTQQGSKLTGTGETGHGTFGQSVALSSDGNTALIGGNSDATKVGAAWVFTRTAATWTQQGSKLTGTGETGAAEFGYAVALSSDGNTALISGASDSSFAGAAWVFTRSTGTWTQQGAKLTGSGEVDAGLFGQSVALSSNGDTALIGGDGDNASTGAAWVFTRSAGTWTQQGSKLTGAGETGDGQFGFSSALSSDGSTALIGGYNDDAGVGAAWAFTRSGSTWTQQGSKLTRSGATDVANFGWSADLSSDGNTALIGSTYDNGGVGAAWTFTRSGTTWTQGSKLTAADEIEEGAFGYSVALSSDATTALIGGPDDDSGVGAAWVFSSSSATVPGAPTGVTATPGDAQASVSFTPPASDGGSAITSYTVTASPGGATASGAGSPLVVLGLTNGTAYTFTVTATNAVGTGPPSAPSSPVTPATVPGAPTGVAAAPGDAQASVSFTAPVSNGGSAISSFTVTASPGGASASDASSPIVVMGLTNGTAYTFTVTATNAVGTGSPSAPSSPVTPATVPGAPTGVAATPGNAQASVSFTAPASNGGAAISSYTVTASPGGATASGASSPIVVMGLTNGTAYTFTVTATNAIGTGAASAPSSPVTPATVPGAPTGVAAAAGNAQASVSFTPPVSNGGSAISSYTVTASPGGATASGASSPIVVMGLTNGTAYTFTVTATNAIGTGAASAPSSPVTPSAVPGAPTGVLVSAGDGMVTVSFAPPVSTGGAPVTSYTVTVSPGGLAVSRYAGPVFVYGLVNGTSYTVTVTATNAAGTGPPSSVSAAFVPVASDGRPAPAPPTEGPRPGVPGPPPGGTRPPVPGH